MFHYSYVYTYMGGWKPTTSKTYMIWILLLNMVNLYCNLCQTKNGLTFHELLVLLKWSVCFFVRQNWRTYLKPPSITTLDPKGQLPVIHPPPVVFFWYKHQPWICDSSMFGTPLRWWWEMLVYQGRSHKTSLFWKSKPTNPTNTYPWLKSHFKQTKATFTLPYQASNFEICPLISSQNQWLENGDWKTLSNILDYQKQRQHDQQNHVTQSHRYGKFLKTLHNIEIIACKKNNEQIDLVQVITPFATKQNPHQITSKQSSFGGPTKTNNKKSQIFHGNQIPSPSSPLGYPEDFHLQCSFKVRLAPGSGSRGKFRPFLGRASLRGWPFPAVNGHHKWPVVIYAV